MKELVTLAVRLIRAGKRAYARKWSFLGVFALVFLGSVSTLAWLDLLPSTKSDVVLDLSKTAPTSQLAAASAPVVSVESPLKIEIPVINLSVNIANPTTTDVEMLDKELLKSAVRYPTSAKLGETGNVVLFGHSSYLPAAQVFNQAYKTFNGIQKLVAGDVVTVSSLGTAYTYRVRSMTKESANGNTAIPLSVAGKVLTLVTCNSFGVKGDRFVVVADFVESHSISI